MNQWMYVMYLSDFCRMMTEPENWWADTLNCQIRDEQYWNRNRIIFKRPVLDVIEV